MLLTNYSEHIEILRLADHVRNVITRLSSLPGRDRIPQKDIDSFYAALEPVLLFGEHPEDTLRASLLGGETFLAIRDWHVSFYTKAQMQITKEIHDTAIKYLVDDYFTVTDFFELKIPIQRGDKDPLRYFRFSPAVAITEHPTQDNSIPTTAAEYYSHPLTGESDDDIVGYELVCNLPDSQKWLQDCLTAFGGSAFRRLLTFMKFYNCRFKEISMVPCYCFSANSKELSPIVFIQPID